MKITVRVSSEPNSVGVLVVICQIIQGGHRLCQFIPSNQLIACKEVEDMEKSLTELSNRVEDLTNESGITPLRCKEQYAVHKC